MHFKRIEGTEGLEGSPIDKSFLLSRADGFTAIKIKKLFFVKSFNLHSTFIYIISLQHIFRTRRVDSHLELGIFSDLFRVRILLPPENLQTRAGSFFCLQKNPMLANKTALAAYCFNACKQLQDAGYVIFVRGM